MKDLEAQLAREKMICPILSFDEVKFFFEKFKGGDANDMTYRTALIDTFVNKIFLYDGDDSRIEIFCNASDKGIKVPLDKPGKGSSKGQMVRAAKQEPASAAAIAKHVLSLPPTSTRSHLTPMVASYRHPMP